MNHRCPVCLFDAMPYPPRDYHICPCCGTEFGNDDAEFTHDELREQWVAGGPDWFYGNPPAGWNPWLQLINGGHPEFVPFHATSATGAAANSKTLLSGQMQVLQVC